jgi:hypothetical protein
MCLTGRLAEAWALAVVREVESFVASAVVVAFDVLTRLCAVVFDERYAFVLI